MPHRMEALPLATLALLAACATAQRGADPAAPSALHRQIAAAEDAWARGIIATDTVALGRILAPEFALVGTDPAEPPFPRAAWMANVGSKRVYTDSVVIDGLAVSGTVDSAVATLRYFWRPIVGGERKGEVWTRLKDSWVRRDGRWQVVQRQVLDPRPAR